MEYRMVWGITSDLKVKNLRHVRYFVNNEWIFPGYFKKKTSYKIMSNFTFKYWHYI